MTQAPSTPARPDASAATDLRTCTARRREALAATMRARGGGVAVLFTAPEILRNRDSEYPYRWDSYFYYLTGFTEPEAALVIRVDANQTRSILFCRDKDPEREIWDGFRHGPEAARTTVGVDEAHPFSALDQKMPELLADQPAVYYALGSSSELDQRLQRWLGGVRALARTGVASPGEAFDITVPLDEMRLIKDRHEQDIMRRAAQISAGAHVRAMQACRPGRFEYEIEAELLHEFRRLGSPFPAYGSIVAGGRNACVLHYRGNDQRLNDQELLLIDAGCEYEGYAADITRTFPVGGRFTDGQRELYEIVLASQKAALDVTRPGHHFNEAHDAAVRVLAQGMIDTGLLTGSLDGVLESGAYRRFYMHRTGHWLGMDVHDCGEYRAPVSRDGAPAGVAAEGGRPWRALMPGMVVTVEPGIYVQAAPDLPERFHNVGIRIEDDALVTPDGHEVLTRDVPKSVAEIEALMRG